MKIDAFGINSDALVQLLVLYYTPLPFILILERVGFFSSLAAAYRFLCFYP
jgi:hypothetical protein